MPGEVVVVFRGAGVVLEDPADDHKQGDNESRVGKQQVQAPATAGGGHAFLLLKPCEGQTIAGQKTTKKIHGRGGSDTSGTKLLAAAPPWQATSAAPDKIRKAFSMAKDQRCDVFNAMPFPCHRLLAAAALMLAASQPATAEDDPPLTLSLVSEVTSIQPGHPFYVGLALHHGRGWHTYWKFPGVVGVPTGIKWKNLPPGFTADSITWPEPQSVLMFQIKAQGYERDVVLPIKITPPAGLADGTGSYRDILKNKASASPCRSKPRQRRPPTRSGTTRFTMNSTSDPAPAAPGPQRPAKARTRSCSL